MTTTQPTSTTTETAREYRRVSVDPDGQERSVDEQAADNQRAADSHGWSLGKPYVDNGRSASRYARKVREDFDRLMTDLTGDRFGADVLILWESSRGSRKEGEWVTLVDLLEERGVKVHVTSHHRTYDPANSRDRRSLLEDALDSAYESSKISERAKRTTAARAAKGQPHGRTPFGYRRSYDPVTRRFVAQDIDPDEGPVVRELFDRIVKGHSMRSITADFNRRGIRTRTGKPWSAQHLRSLAVTRAYIAEREWTPGRKGGQNIAHPTSIVAGTWPALVSRATFLAVQRILTAPERVTTRPGRGVHLLSMIATCGVCGGPLAVTMRYADGPMYYCHKKGCVRIDKAGLDELAEEVMLRHLAGPDVYDKLAAGPDEDDPQLAAVRDELAEARTAHDDLADAVAAGTVSVALASRSEPKLVARINDLTAREQALSTPSKLRGLIKPGKGVADRWAVAPMSTKRQLARILLSPDHLGVLRVLRSPTPRRRVPVRDRVEVAKITR